MMVLLGLVMLFKAYQIRAKDKNFSSIYLIIGITLIVIALLNFTFVKIIAVIGLAIFLLTNPRVQKIINKEEEPKNP
jgi:multisubunit Na+/H+ antiporter MnhG subunit